MSCHEVAAALTLIGLAGELVAVVFIVRSVGALDFVGRTRDRFVAWLDRVLPWSFRRRFVYGDGVLVGTGRLEGTGRRTTVRDEAEPSPKTWDDVGNRLNRIAADLNLLDQKIDEREDLLRDEMWGEVKRVDAEAAARHDRLDEKVAARVRTEIAQRKTEGLLFIIGLGFQLGGAVLVLTC